MLFLNKLRRLRVVNVAAGETTELHRSDKGAEVEILRTTTTQGRVTQNFFRYYRHVKEVSMSGVADDMRPDMATSKVIVAVPVGEDGAVDGSVGRQLFAFLPIRESGLRFVAHADFILNTSREDVMRTRAWNTRLRDELGTALAEAVMAMQGHGKVGRTALRAISRPAGVIDPFIRPILERAVDALKARQCVPVAADAWAHPSAAVRHDATRLSELIPETESERLVGRSLVDRTCTGILDALDLLTVGTFQLSDLLKACEQAAWMGSRPTEWLVDLYRRLEPLSQNDDVAQQLRGAKILRLVNKTFVAAASGSVFRSLSRRTTYGFETHLKILCPEILNVAGASSTLSAVDGLLRRLRVRDAEPSAVIDDHVLPFHRGTEWRTCDGAVLVGHLRYLREHLDAYLRAKGDASETALKSLRDSIWLYTARVNAASRYVRHAADLYVGDEYGNPNRLQWLLGAIDEHLVASDYLAGTKPEDRAKEGRAWAALFERLGSHVLPKVVASTQAPSHAKVPPPQRGYSSAAISASDWVPSTELAQLIQSDDHERKAVLLEMLDRHWLGHWSGFQTCTVTRGYQSAQSRSSFVVLLRSMVIRDKRGVAGPLAGHYQDTEGNHTVFGNGVRYLARPLTSHEFMQVAGVVAEPTVEEVLGRLVQMSQQGAGDRRAVYRLYQFLDQRWEGREALIAECFRDHAIVWVGSDTETSWTNSSQCCWHVPVRLRPAAPIRSVQAAWSRLEEFFCEKLCIRRDMSPEEWVATLLAIADIEVEENEAGELARQAYREIEACLKKDGYAVGGEIPEWFGPLVSGASVWTTSHEWRQNDGALFVGDDPTLAGLFADSSVVGFIDVPTMDLPKFVLLLDALRLGRVSLAPREPVATGGSQDASTISDRIQERWMQLARLLYTKKDTQTAYFAARDSGQLTALKSITSLSWSPLTLEVVLTASERRRHRFDCKISGTGGAIVMMVDSEQQDNWQEIGREIGQWLSLDEASCDRVGAILALPDDQAVEKWLFSRQVHQLPPDELRRLMVLAGDTEGLDIERADEEETQESWDDDLVPASAELPAGEAHPALDTPSPSESESHPESVNSVPSGSALGRASGSTGGNASSAGSVLTSQAGSGGHAGTLGAGAPPNAPSGPPTTPDSLGTGVRKQQRSPGRMISYVESSTDPDRNPEMDEQARANRDRIELAAVEYVMTIETREKRRPELREHTNPGYDIESFAPTGESDRYIEVKGLKGAWGERGVTLTAVQYAFARKHGARAWLYVVEYADDSSKREVWMIQDPASKITRYGFDHGWRSAAASSEAGESNAPVLVENARWKCDDGVIGVIEAIKRSPSFVNIRVLRPDGSVVSRTGPERLLARSLVGE